MNFPNNLKYTKDHEWVLVEGDTVTIGVTDFAQHELGDIVYVDIDNSLVGETVKQEEVFGTVEAVKTVSDLFMPITAEITAINAELGNTPDSVNKDPYGKGWMVKAKVADAAQLVDLLSADDYKAHIGQ